MRSINRALEGLPSSTVIHMCFGYAAMVSDKPAGYSFLPQLAGITADAISMEAARAFGKLKAMARSCSVMSNADIAIIAAPRRS